MTLVPNKMQNRALPAKWWLAVSVKMYHSKRVLPYMFVIITKSMRE